MPLMNDAIHKPALCIANFIIYNAGLVMYTEIGYTQGWWHQPVSGCFHHLHQLSQTNRQRHIWFHNFYFILPKKL